MGEALNKRLVIALACALLAGAVSGLLLLQHHGEPGAVQTVNEACGDGKTSACEVVARSSWSSLQGIPLAALGLLFSLVLATACALALSSESETKAALAGLALVLLGAALGVDAGLGLIQAFVVKAFCGFCVATYVLNAVAFAALWPAREALRGALTRASSSEARPVLVGLVLAALAATAGVTAFDHALTARAALRSATLLGAPAAPGPAPGPAAPHDHDHSAAVSPGPGAPSNWQAEARRLQAILDDPHQLDRYFADKAARQYAAAKVESPDLDGVPAKGQGDAPVKVVVYSDFLCPFCRSLAGALSSFLGQAGGRVQIFYKNYPLDQACNPNLQRSAHDGACVLAQGAICAQEQGKFWAYHDRVFARAMEKATRADASRFASEGGLDGPAFSACLDTQGTRDRLAAQIAEAKRVGVDSTPTLLINGKKLPRINDFLQVVNSESQARGLPPLPTGGAPNH